MTTPRHLSRLATLALLPAVLLVSACGPDDNNPPSPTVTNATPATTAPAPAPTRTAAAPAPAPVVAPVHSDLRGQVVSIEPIVQQDKATGAGAALGGVLGAVVGHQIGGGDGRKVATVAGAVGGAVVGNHVEKKRSEHVTGYRISVRTDAGNTRQFERTSVSDLSVGSSVRIVEGKLQPA